MENQKQIKEIGVVLDGLMKYYFPSEEQLGFDEDLFNLYATVSDLQKILVVQGVCSPMGFKSADPNENVGPEYEKNKREYELLNSQFHVDMELIKKLDTLLKNYNFGFCVTEDDFIEEKLMEIAYYLEVVLKK